MRVVRNCAVVLAVGVLSSACAGDVADQGEISSSDGELTAAELAEGELEQGDLAGGERTCEAPNGASIRNEYGASASHSTQGFIDQCGAFFTPQGTNGRSCTSCHAAEAGWSMSSAVMQRMFWRSEGRAPVFNALDADRGGSDPVDTLEQRRYAYSMLLKGKFLRKQTVPAGAEFEVVSAEDPFGKATTTNFWFFRRSMPTANFRSHLVSWDGATTMGTDLHAGLARQARGNITGAQQGTAPADEVIVEEIVQFEKALSHAQVNVSDAGRLDSNGARGGPKHLSAQPFVAGPFDLFNAWSGSSNYMRARIARGQKLFNMTRDGKSCGGCHNAANDGQNVYGVFFDIGASRPEFAEPDMAVFTMRNLTTGEVRQTTDGGRGWRTGRWSDLDRFKTPSLRGIAARGEYFHNGIARSLEEVVQFYEKSLGFRFTRDERRDLVAFLRAL